MERENLVKQIDPNQKVPLSEKLFFGSADMYGGGAQALITAVYLVFLVNNDVPIKLAGLIVMISRLWDAISDPLMGVISDNTRTKWGRRRPYIFIGGILVIIAFALLFMPLYGVQSVGLKFTIYLFAYLFYSTVSTVINVPYSSMSAEISTDYDEKTKVNTIRLVFSMASSGISAAVPILLIESLQDGKMRVNTFSTIMILVFGIFYCLPLVLAAIKCKERIELPKEKSVFSIKTFLRPLQVKAFLYLLIMYLCAYTCMDIVASNVIFFAEYGINFSQSSFFILAIIMVSYALMVPVLSSLLNKGWAKPFLFRVGIPLYVLGIIILTMYPIGFAEWPIYLICVMIGVGMSGCQMMPWIIFPDVVDVGELKFNERTTGSYSGIMTFIRKSTSAIAIAITSWGLSISGFKEPVTDYETGFVQKFAQSESAILGLRLVILIPVLIFVTIAYIYARKLKLTPKKSYKIKDFIDMQKENPEFEDTLCEEDKMELKEIKEDLF